jgi:hypothetical protein
MDAQAYKLDTVLTEAASSLPLRFFPVACIIVTCFVALKRLYLHPLSEFPGPKLAAITGWFESYHEAVLGGTYVKRYEDWHRKYGMVSWRR